MRRALLALLLAAASCSFPDYAVQEAEHVPVETCRDGLLSLNEIDVDCGPACGAGCAAGKSCTSDQECESGFCAQGVCAIPSCTDNAKNRTETDVDCGGSDACKACGVGQRCATAFDCDGGACNNGRCLAPSCSDGIQNQDEADVDCGGSQGCDRCETKQHCVTTDDCLKAVCSQGRCQAFGCDDGIRNGDETGLDCGGSCPSCPDFSACSTSDDCRSLVCSPQALMCLAATCSDDVQNGSEPATDCGAGCAQKCAITQPCTLDADCQNGVCADQRCVPESATGAALPTSGWIASASVTENQNAVPRKAIDGDAATHWASGTSQVPGMWYQVDMLQPRAFFAIELTCLTNDDYPRSLRVLLSDDGQNFTAATGTLAGEKVFRIDFAPARIARHIKLELQQNTGGTWWRIDELRVLQ
jgi:hypothetical protein